MSGYLNFPPIAVDAKALHPTGESEERPEGYAGPNLAPTLNQFFFKSNMLACIPEQQPYSWQKVVASGEFPDSLRGTPIMQSVN